MAILVDQDVGLDEKRVRMQGGDWCLESYPLQISMYHSLTVHIYQPLGDVLELPGIISGSCGRPG